MKNLLSKICLSILLYPFVFVAMLIVAIVGVFVCPFVIVFMSIDSLNKSNSYGL